MTNATYRAAVERLEQWLSPRVVSRTLRMGMQPEGLTPETVDADGLEPILTGPVLRQLKASLPADRAEREIDDLLQTLREIDAAPEAPAEAPAEPKPAASGDAATTGAASEAAPAAREDAAAAPSAAQDPHPEGRRALEALQGEARPFNLYFEWPEVRKLRAQLQLFEDEVQAGGRGEALEADVRNQLDEVRQKLEDTLVLQARELAELEEALEEVRALGGSKVRRLEGLVNQVRSSQAGREPAQAEVERARKLARDLRKLMASSAFRNDGGEAEEGRGGEALEAHLRQLDVEGEREDLAALERAHGTLIDYRPEFGERLTELRDRSEENASIANELAALRGDLAVAERETREALTDELDGIAAHWADATGSEAEEVNRNLEILRGVAERGLPPLADVARLRDVERLARETAEAAGARDAALAQGQRQRLDAQRELLDRLDADLLRYGDDADDATERLRTALRDLRAAQAEERVDVEAADEARDAAAALTRSGARDDDPLGPGRRQVRALLTELDHAVALDPERAAEVRAELERMAEEAEQQPLEEHALSAAAAAVSDLLDRVRSDARARLDALSTEAGRWGLHDALSDVQAANERLEDGHDPDLPDVERTVDEARARRQREQLERLHELQRERERLRGVDETLEASLDEALKRAREACDAKRPASGLDEASQAVDALRATIERRIADFGPRLETARAAFTKVERLNSDDVATVRRILNHLHGQRDAFERVSPGLRAQLEGSLQEAEELLGKLDEEEQATRAIADRLVHANLFDDVLGAFGGGDAEAASGPDDGAPDEDAAGAWLRQHARGHGVRAGTVVGDDGVVRASTDARTEAEHLAHPAVALVRASEHLGNALGRGAARLVTVERDDGAVAVRRAPGGCALLAADDPSALGLLLHGLREEDGLASALSRTEEAGGDGGPG